MEGTEESSSSKLLTKSSRKRQRKRQAAALEKFFLASEAAGLCNIEPVQGSNADSVTVKGCLSNIVFNNNSVGGKECFAENNSQYDAINNKAKSVCCEPSKNEVLEKNQNPEQNSDVPHLKRRRNRRKVNVPETSSDNTDGTAVPVCQKHIDTQSSQHANASQKDSLKQEKSSLNHSVFQGKCEAKIKDLQTTEATVQSENKSDFKSLCVEGDKESTLSRAKKRRNRKKALASSENCDPHAQGFIDEELEAKVIPECPPQFLSQQLSPQKGCFAGQRLDLNPSISSVSGSPSSGKKISPVIVKSGLNSGEAAVGINRKDTKKEGKSKVSDLPEKLRDIGKQPGNSRCSTPSKRGEETRVTDVEVIRDLLDLKKKGTGRLPPVLNVVKSGKVSRADALELAREKEQILSSLIFLKSANLSPSKRCVCPKDHSASMEEAKKSESKARPVPKESKGKDSGKVTVKGVSKFITPNFKATPVNYDETDRSSAPVHSVTVEPQSGETLSMKEFLSKHGNYLKEIPEGNTLVSKGAAPVHSVTVEPQSGETLSMKEFLSKRGNYPKEIPEGNIFVSKGAAPTQKAAPVPVDVLDESVICMDSDRIETKLESHKKDNEYVSKSIGVGVSLPERGNSSMEKPNPGILVSKGASLSWKGASVLSERIESKLEPSKTDDISLPELSTERETSSKGGDRVEITSNVSQDIEAVAQTVADKGKARGEKIIETSKKDGKSADVSDESKEKIKAEREARKAAKLAKKQKDKLASENNVAKVTTDTLPKVLNIKELMSNKEVSSSEGKPPVLPSKVLQESEKTSAEKSKAELRAERRAKQEAQRAAKAASLSKPAPAQSKVKSAEGVTKAVPPPGAKAVQKQLPASVKRPKEPSMKLLSRLGWGDGRVKRSTSEDATLKDTQPLHPAIVQLSTKFTDRIVSGSNARCLAFVQAIQKAIQDYQTPPQKELGRDLEARLLTPSLTYLESQRPHAVSVSNATKFLKWQLTQLQPLQNSSSENSTGAPSEIGKIVVKSDEEAKQILIEGLDAYIWEKIEVAERAVCDTLRDKIKDGDVILTYGCSYLLQQILTEAKKSGTKFKVVVVDGRPWREGREMLRCLVAVGIPCSYVLLSAASSVMRQVNKVLLGAHALLSNGYVMSRVGVSQVALLASAHNVPVLVACETHKFCERVQSDSFVYNEMGEPDGLAQLLGGEDGPLSDWRSIPSLSLLNLSYDVTPPELVTAVATELAVLPCTSVPVVLRVRPAEPITSRH